VAGVVGGVAAAYWARFGPEWRGWHWLAALIGGIVLSGIFAVLLGIGSRLSQP
jgi:hypothetical protein